MPPKGAYVGKNSKDAYIEYRNPEKESADKYRMTAPNVFSSPTKCPKCKGKLILTRKHDRYEYLLCVKCKRRFVRDVFSIKEMEEYKDGETRY